MLSPPPTLFGILNVFLSFYFLFFLANCVLVIGQPVVSQVSRDLRRVWRKRASSVSLPLEQKDKVISACVTERGRNEHG